MIRRKGVNLREGGEFKMCPKCKSENEKENDLGRVIFYECLDCGCKSKTVMG